MKTMKCNQLGGACEHEFRANTFEEMAEMSRQHCMKMFEQNDQAHLDAMHEMKILMAEPDAMAQWFADRRAEFAALDDDE